MEWLIREAVEIKLHSKKMEKEVTFFPSRSQKLLIIHSLTARKQTFSENVKVILSFYPHQL
jgi:hypothetical protein